MSPGIDYDTAAKQAALDLDRRTPAEFRTATDIASPIARYIEFKIDPSTLGEQTPVSPLHFDSWLFETLFIIESYRSVSDGWDGGSAPRPSKEALDAAEMLSAFFTIVRYEKRPTLCVDALGRPNFATNTSELYLHLTVEMSGRLTWYSVLRGIEGFADEIEFDGRKLPDQLQHLLFSDPAA
jgi:hypothetical protein